MGKEIMKFKFSYTTRVFLMMALLTTGCANITPPIKQQKEVVTPTPLDRVDLSVITQLLNGIDVSNVFEFTYNGEGYIKISIPIINGESKDLFLAYGNDNLLYLVHDVSMEFKGTNVVNIFSKEEGSTADMMIHTIYNKLTKYLDETRIMNGDDKSE